MLKIFFKINFTVTIVWNTRETGDIYHDKFSTLCHRTMNTWYNPFSILNVWILPLGALGMDICEGSILWGFLQFFFVTPFERALKPSESSPPGSTGYIIMLFASFKTSRCNDVCIVRSWLLAAAFAFEATLQHSIADIRFQLHLRACMPLLWCNRTCYHPVPISHLHVNRTGILFASQSPAWSRS